MEQLPVSNCSISIQTNILSEDLLNSKFGAEYSEPSKNMHFP